MKTFLIDIFPKIYQYSEKLDNLTLLTNQHWVSIDNILLNKTVYIFRPNNDLLVSTNGKIEKARWEYLGNKYLLIELKDESYLLKQEFFDENILALRIDGGEESIVFVNENKYNGELNTIDKIYVFLQNKYINPIIKSKIETSTGQILIDKNIDETFFIGNFITDRGNIKVLLNFRGAIPALGNKVYMADNDIPAPNGKYKIGFMNYLIVKNGAVVDITAF